jgi:hypothetical protein
MAFIGGATLPANYQEFLESVTQPLVLPTPEPQYLFAQWAMAGRLNFQALDAGKATVQQYLSAAGGGAMAPDLERMIRVADMYPGFVQAIDVFGKGKGDTVKFQRPIFSTGGLTEASRELTPNSAISTTGLAIQSEEVPAVLRQYHGPYSSSGSAVQPYAIDNFSAKFQANKLSLTSQVNAYLVRDYTKWLDIVIRDRLRASQYTTLSDSALTDASSFVAGGNAFINLEAILRARKALSDREWMPFPNGRYALLVPTVFNTQMLSDVDYRESAKNHADGRNQIFGYINSVQDIDIFECTTLKSYAAGTSVTGEKAGTVGTSVALEEALLVGPGAVGFGTAAPDPENVAGPVARFADDTNYGTMIKVIWYALHAFQTLDERGVQRILFQSA